jgi:hypothetical protein
MCPNGDKEALIFYLEFSGKIQSVHGGGYISFKQQYPCSARSNRDCTALDCSKDYIEIAYRCTKCDVNPCSSTSASATPSTSASAAPSISGGATPS